MMRREGGRVVIDISDEEFDSLTLALGMATGWALRIGNKSASDSWLRLVNSVNVGNSNFTPYEVAQEPKPAEAALTTKRGTAGFGSTGR